MGKRQIEDEITISNDYPELIAAAPVHPVLALVVAMALDSGRREWLNVAGNKLND